MKEYYVRTKPEDLWFMNKPKQMKNETIDHKILSKHFNKTPEAMRQLKRKHEKDGTGLWSIYVKAYNFDNNISKG